MIRTFELLEVPDTATPSIAVISGNVTFLPSAVMVKTTLSPSYTTGLSTLTLTFASSKTGKSAIIKILPRLLFIMALSFTF